jgi:hypothetical protein
MLLQPVDLLEVQDAKQNEKAQANASLQFDHAAPLFHGRAQCEL